MTVGTTSAKQQKSSKQKAQRKTAKKTAKKTARKTAPYTSWQLQSIEALAQVSEKFRLTLADPRNDPADVIERYLRIKLEPWQVEKLREGQSSLTSQAACIKQCLGDPPGDLFVSLVPR